jgi:hypothetical protein
LTTLKTVCNFCPDIRLVLPAPVALPIIDERRKKAA